MSTTKPKILVVLGPTATGKSVLAVRLAKKFGGEVVSADSRQVYRGLDIGTAKITKAEMKGVRHHMLDVANPKKQFSADLYTKLVQKSITEIISRDKLPIICGGTGFYISALLGEISLSSIPPNQALRKSLSKKNAEELFVMLKKLNPARAATIEKQNPRRLIRAIEIAKFTRSDLVNKVGPCRKFKTLKIGLVLPKNELKIRIAARLHSRLKKGMLAEAKHLHKKGLSWKRMDELGLEYRYMARYLQNKISREEMLEKIKTESWRYSKRQITWFKRDKNIAWFSPTDKRAIEKEATCFLHATSYHPSTP